MSEELIRLEHVSYHYEEIPALADLSCSISKEECI